MLENQIEEKLRIAVKKKGGEALKFVSPGNKGVPDRLIFMPGGRLYIREMKTPTGKLDPLQKYWQRRFKALGFDVSVISDTVMVKVFIDEI